MNQVTILYIFIVLPKDKSNAVLYNSIELDMQVILCANIDAYAILGVAQSAMALKKKEVIIDEHF